MIVWCQLCATETVEVNPDDALHESFKIEGQRDICETCYTAMDIALEATSQFFPEVLGTPPLWGSAEERRKILGTYEPTEWFSETGLG